jgi:hypothetical protein
MTTLVGKQMFYIMSAQENTFFYQKKTGKQQITRNKTVCCVVTWTEDYGNVTEQDFFRV